MECDKLQKLLFHYGIESYKHIEKNRFVSW